MTFARRTADPCQMTAAALKVRRESLGLTTAWTAERMGVRERSVHRWEAGASPVPIGVQVEMDYLEDLTGAAVEAMRGEAQATGTVVTYRTDADYRRADPESWWPASWHRAVTARVVRDVPGVAVTYCTP